MQYGPKKNKSFFDNLVKQNENKKRNSKSFSILFSVLES